MHYWGDGDFDWEKFGQVVSFFCAQSNKYRIGGQIKEKYGTLRWYAHFNGYALHDLFWPGHVYFYRYQQPSFWHWSVRWAQPVLGRMLKIVDMRIRKWEWFQKKCVKFQVTKYVETYEKALRKWPEFKEEIMMAADHQELLKDLFPFEDYWE
jgi:hypothetical protein